MTRPAAWARRRSSQTPGTDVITMLAIALAAADAEGIRRLLHTAIVTVVDSGGATGDAPTGALHGPDAAAAALQRSAVSDAVTTASVNAAPGIVIRHQGRITAVVCANTRAGQIVELWIIRNPEKLRRWDRS